MASCFLSPAASSDIDRIWMYIFENNSRAADEIVAELYRAFDTLADNPRMGILRPELHGTPRSFPMTGRPYVIFYLPREDGVRILRIIHTSQDLEQAY